MTKQEVLDQCLIEGNIVKLPDVQLDRALYMEVNKSLQGIGGKWDRRVKGFQFETDPSKLMGRVQNGEKVNLKKEFQFFETPDELADWLVELAELPRFYQTDDDYIYLEPSAGRGAIIKAIRRIFPQITIDAFELMDQNRPFIEAMNKPGAKVRLYFEPDFLKTTPEEKYSRIIANPPFTKNQDIDHVRHMYEWLVPGGRLVSVMSSHWTFSRNKKELAFKNFIFDTEAKMENIEPGTFKTSGTMVGGCIVIIDKPYE